MFLPEKAATLGMDRKESSKENLAILPFPLSIPLLIFPDRGKLQSINISFLNQLQAYLNQPDCAVRAAVTK